MDSNNFQRSFGFSNSYPCFYNLWIYESYKKMAESMEFQSKIMQREFELRVAPIINNYTKKKRQVSTIDIQNKDVEIRFQCFCQMLKPAPFEQFNVV